MPDTLRQRLETMLGAPVVHSQPLSGGMTLVGRWLLELADHRRLFVKAAGNPTTIEWLRREHYVYSRLAGLPFVPQMVAWSDQDRVSVLVIEDLSHAHWPPPWSSQQVQQALETLADAHRQSGRCVLPSLVGEVTNWRCWHRIAADPRPFLAQRVCDAGWLKVSLPTLIDAENRVSLDGNDLVHGDFTSGNICVARQRGVVLIDWNRAAIGCGTLDVAVWLPKLAAEANLAPETILPGHGDWAALVSGDLAHRSSRPPPPQAPSLRDSQRRRLPHALAWACRELKLPLPVHLADRNQPLTQ
jgi:hypothetical protein